MNVNMVNGNMVGAKMLAYLRSEKDLFQERARIAELKKQAAKTGLGYWLNNPQRRRVQKLWTVVGLLQEDGRMTVTEIAKRTNLPISTAFDLMKEVEKHFRFTIVFKDEEKEALVSGMPARFEFSYRAAVEEDAKEAGLQSYLE